MHNIEIAIAITFAFEIFLKMKLEGQTVLITGGASGIGRIMGRMALQKGASLLVIWDINQANIDTVCAELSSYGRVVGYRVDVSDQEDIAKTYQSLKKECGEVDILIQCAGIITTNRILKAIEKEKDFKGLPFGFHFIRFWQGVLPTRFFDWLFGEVFGIYHTMDNFTGRTSK